MVPGIIFGFNFQHKKMKRFLYILFLFGLTCFSQDNLGAWLLASQQQYANESSNDSFDISGLVFRMDETSVDATATVEANDTDIWTDLINGNNATNTGTDSPELHITSGSVRQVTFDGSNDFLRVGSPAVLDFAPTTDEFTIVVKLGENISASGGYFLCKSDNSSTASSNRQYGLGYDNGDIFCFVGGTDSRGTKTASSGELVIMTVSTTALNVWSNTTQVITDASIGNNTTTGNLIIGARTDGSGAHFNGDLQAVLMYDRVITAQEITDMQNQYVP